MGQQRVNPDISKVYLTTAPGGPFMAAGTKFTHRHATYGEWECKFVLVDSGSVAIAAGDIVCWKLTTGRKTGTITNDITDISAGPDAGIVANHAAGIALAAVTLAQATAGTAMVCILVNGYYPTVNITGATVTVGDAIIHGGATDGVGSKVDDETAPGVKLVGWATAADDTNAVATDVVMN